MHLRAHKSVERVWDQGAHRWPTTMPIASETQSPPMSTLSAMSANGR